MDELGIIIFPNGEEISFGEYVPVDDPKYTTSPTHEEYFIKEVLPTFQFKSTDFDYNKEEMLYKNLTRLANQGLISLLNKDGGILAYVAPNPTLEQINTILNNNKINSITEQEVYEFIEEDDFIDHNSMKDYAISKQNAIGGKGIK